MSRPKVAILSRNFMRRAGGGEHYAVSLTDRLKEEYDIHVFSQSHDHLDGVAFHDVPILLARPRWVNLLWFNIYTWLKCRNYPIIHSHEMVPFANVSTIHVRCSTPDFNQYQGLQRAIKRIKFFTSLRKLSYLWLEQKQLEPAKRRKIIVVSEILKNQIRNIYQYNTDHYLTIQPGINPPIEINKREAQGILGLSDDKFYILLVSNDFISKGLEPLIESISTLDDNIHLLVAGNDRQDPYKQLSKKLGISHRVHFLGSRKDMEVVYSACDILVHPTAFDTYGMVALEAMSHSKPVIISNKEYCGISHDLSSEAIFLRNPKDHMEISSAINLLYFSESLRKDLSRKGKIFSEMRSWKLIEKKYSNIYNEILQKTDKD